MPPNPTLPRRRSIRLKNYDYTSPGAYFITICTYARTLYFDDLSIRDIAAARWQAIPDHTPNVSLDQWVVMPNHVHGLLVFEPSSPEAAKPMWPTGAQGQGHMSSISPHGRSLAVVVRAYKAAVTGACRKAGKGFAWQDGYYEHVVRDATDLDHIRRYIRDNPLKWELDSEHPSNRAR